MDVKKYIVCRRPSYIARRTKRATRQKDSFKQTPPTGQKQQDHILAPKIHITLNGTMNPPIVYLSCAPGYFRVLPTSFGFRECAAPFLAGVLLALSFCGSAALIRRLEGMLNLVCFAFLVARGDALELLVDCPLVTFVFAPVFGFARPALTLTSRLPNLTFLGLMAWDTLEAVFFKPDLTEDDVLVDFLLLFTREVESSRTPPSSLSRLCLVPASFDLDFGLGLGFDLDWVSSLDLVGCLGLGPNTPRHEGVPQRHSWTFFWEKGLSFC